MFKKLKDKLAEEVKSSPQRLHQFAQAAQAAVTSASSSISDITNNDLFSIGDNDSANKSPISTPNTKLNPGTSFGKPESINVSLEAPDFSNDNQRLRRLSNSSFSSDISFRLPSYESPSMYHLQSDMEVSASEAEEKSPFGGNVNLDRVTKEQLYAAYRRTQDRCKKYKTQYSDLARHYKLLERENAKAKNVLVETQDKALRRISELREQCSLEQSAKAHLEQVLRTEIEEKNMKIESLNANLNILKSNSVYQNAENKAELSCEQQLNSETEGPLINFDKENSDSLPNDVTVLNSKIEKMEQLLNKYKESLKIAKEKNSQLTIEMNKITTDLENKSKENETLQAEINLLSEAKKNIEELNETIEQLRNKNNTLEFQKNKELSIVEINLKNAQEEILKYKSKIDVLSKREEEYAISLAENKLSIHKELESKETEIKALKISLSSTQSEIKNLEKKVNECKIVIEEKEKEHSQLKTSLNELELCKANISEYETQLEALSEKNKLLENSNSKLEEEYKCLHLQLKQETAEKLAMIDRNTYLENRNEQLLEDNSKKNNKVKDLENELNIIKDSKSNSCESTENSEEITKLNEELLLWKNKCTNLESEFQDEKVELGKLQAEIEKLLQNYEHVQKENLVMSESLEQVKRQNCFLKNQITDTESLKCNLNELKPKFKDLRYVLKSTAGEVKALKSLSTKEIDTFNKQLNTLMQNFNQKSSALEVEEMKSKLASLEKELQDKSQQYLQITEELDNAKKMHENLLVAMKEQNIIHRKHCEEISALKAEKCEIETELQEFKKQSEILEKSVCIASTEKQTVLEQINKLQEKYSTLLNHFKILEDEKKQLKKDVLQFEELKSKQAFLEKELQNKSEQYLQTVGELENAKKVHKKVLVAMKEHSSNDKKHDDTIKAMTAEKCKIESELIESKKQLEILENNVSKSNTEKQVVLEEMDKIKDKYSKLSNNVNVLEDEKRKLTEVHEKNIVLLKESQDRLVALNKDYEELMKIKQENDKQAVYVESLEKEIKKLTKENLSLKESSEKISKNLDEIETEMKELKISHINIVKEKDHLNNIIEKLEENNNKSYEHKESQSDLESELNKNIKNVESLKQEIKLLLQMNKELTEKLTVRDTENTINENNDLLTECEFLRKENKRLLSDIEGLQTYMSKVSKENDELNNKIRELISSGESTTEQIGVLKDDTHSNKEKIEELLRENSLLIEENLELKDQIQSQTLKEHDVLDDNIEKNRLKNKDEYEQLVKSKAELENRLRDLEEMNYRVNSDMLTMQDNNKKLKLSNEKLERKLDEALVSLRHLHSLQENTELEYLKNILYEYLTGSGTHSYTLAKVLAAVVKFDDKQTDTVLQKEKERQGVLRQLGII
ncbi:putative leucine-rich repeat-containing protein DDB_G0290503 [Aricia agestis]|uniref:putative leucine-rich repeat-containing protein DDB_G0290503 n=1 Tax=Aricia agestis TaxID=91739 RepID=UPI001C2024DD|nr:putative leucine-rich repeat-containing protein DDB_G0290503 [Aricia agestis]